ncbi:imidazolonepropionase-like amidohydrolase [Dyadobacter jejuensis]|uniref:Imidazolonepropionase-like amidohydrolase n=1 Tax=Dyadobacter jejuensis TaxID=1082580 RepID=A0A316AM14_9BACT|nr:amidohydrolase family protein [Dyadobacter jejuensis]PWJ58468.1 imidazolonepropionase-like amidohydrolase [Dyadobacter jejuensis]
MFKHLSKLVFCFLLMQYSYGQQTFPRNGAYDERAGRYAFTNATIIVNPQQTIQNGTLLIEGGVIKAIGPKVAIPQGTVVVDLQGKFLYPSLIDLDSDYGLPAVQMPARSRGRQTPQLESNKKGAFGWNQAIQPEIDASLQFVPSQQQAESLRKLGFGTALIHAHDGIVRGSGALVTLADLPATKVLLQEKASAHFSFSKGSSTQTYPSSVMGATALLRQTYYDAQWYEKSQRDEGDNLSLKAFNQIKKLPSFFETTDKYSLLRADKLGDEFGIQYIIKGSGDEYQRLEEIKNTGATLLLPVDFPSAYDLTDPWDSEMVSLAQLKHWELAPKNLAYVAEAGIPFALTMQGLKQKSDFWKNLRLAIDQGLSKSVALEALTVQPAKLIGAEKSLGTLEKGKIASFLVTSSDLFESGTIIYENWIQGQRYILTPTDLADIRGTYNLVIDNQPSGKLKIGGKAEQPNYSITTLDSSKITPKVQLKNELLTLSFKHGKDQSVRLTGWKDAKGFVGEGLTADGKTITWSAPLVSAFEAEAPKDTTKPATTPTGAIWYPLAGYGNLEVPQAQDVLIQNTTVWTNEKEGILEETDVLVRGGKIAKVGKGLQVASGVKVINGKGKHLTSGIIDEHSHIALFSVNEGGQSSSAEVRMSDVVNPDDVNIYRQLSGGVTASQLLHGSANAIGGQSAMIKLKWGGGLKDLLLPQVKSIKFALGENVKQSNWGDVQRYRFPQTRMGVEQVYFDHFIRAKEYAQQWDAYNKLSKKDGVVAPRRDLELDALAEILADERAITCHSYVQSEINMLMHVADSLNFRVNTFTHILEGYKLADKMADRKIGGSTFADWWAYKMEVKEAIPYNAALMYHEGVTVAINSDDAEMARRLNQEAAKTVLYGGVPQEEAWKMVTLNPAKLLHLDDRMGSVKVGKDADLVLWNDHPLSIYARPDFTMIEGAFYFDRKLDEAKQAEMDTERARITQKMMADKDQGKATQKPQMVKPKMWHCEDLDEAAE